MRVILHLVFTIVVCFSALSQNTIGLPDIINYSKQQYKAGAQNRQIRQDKKGVMYFANSEGLLTYDGVKWKTYPISNNSIVRSIEFGPDNKLYVGGQDEFGYFSPDNNGILKYHSLKHLLPKDQQSFTDIWEIYFFKNSVFFQSSNNIYQINNNESHIFNSIHWRFITTYNDKLIAQDFQKGLVSFEKGTWKPFLTKSELPDDYFATSLTAIGPDSAILTTIKNGSYIMAGSEVTKINSPFMDQLASANISASAMVNDNHIALTTNLEGCFIIDKKGNLVQKFSRKEGIQNNNILDVFLDKERNLWLGLDNGIDFIAYNNAIKHIYPDYFNEGSGYAASIFNGDLFIGTSNGLYKTRLYEETDLSFVKGQFDLIPNTKGQVWNLSQVNGKLLMGHHEGAFLIEDNVGKPIDKSSGFWNFQTAVSILPSTKIIAGTYQGFNIYTFKNGTYVCDSSLKAHFESARFVTVDNDNIWVAHPYKGIYKVQIINNKPIIKNYTAKEGVMSVNGDYIFKIKNKIILTTEKGIFEYNRNRDDFESSKFFNDIFYGKSIRYLKEDGSGNIWFVFDKIMGVVDMSLEKPQIIYFPELTNKFVSGFEMIYPVNKNNVFIGGERGFYHINFEQYKQLRYPLQVQITSATSMNEKDSILYGGYSGEVNDDEANMQKKRIKVNHSSNSFHFDFSSPVYAQQSNIQYSYFLIGFDEKWSEFSSKADKEYTNLPAGDYTFKVKARNNLGNESAEGVFNFTVLPPWYQSVYAYAVYLCLFIFANYFLYRVLKRKFQAQKLKYQREQERLLYLHQLELEKTDKEIVKLKNEKLEAEILHKNTELASVAMHLVQKGELLGKIKDQVVHLKKKSENETDADGLKKIIKVISDEDKIDKQWEQFTIHFDSVHSDFLSQLKSKVPTLSSNELKLSAYLRMNLSTKEIAQLMNISVRGVEISRYRLRKKLQIPTEVNLFDFLLKLNEQQAS